MPASDNPGQNLSAKSAPGASRRDFLRSTAIVGGAIATGAAIARTAHAAGADAIRVGLIGCGGRGTSAAMNVLAADPGVRITALCDVFADQLEICRESLKARGVEIADDHCFTDFDGYKKLIDLKEIDVVLLCTPPHFRPAQYRYAVEKNKHVFVEKPVAVDPTGLRSVLETNVMAKEKGLGVLSGLCWRYHYGMRETVRRIHEGAIGDVTAIQTNYNGGYLWNRPRKPEWSDMEYQMRNWLYYTWLSGDLICEQHIHSLDKTSWILGNAAPIRAVGLGGRQTRVEPQWGNVFDHHAVTYEFENGVKVFSFCRQVKGTPRDVEDYVIGSKGRARLIDHVIEGETNWKYEGKNPSFYDLEQAEFIASLRAGKPLYNGDYMANSTMMAIMGRMATYTGQVVEWEKAMKSKLDLSPPQYAWGDLKADPVAKPGVTRLI